MKTNKDSTKNHRLVNESSMHENKFGIPLHEHEQKFQAYLTKGAKKMNPPPKVLLKSHKNPGGL